MEWKRARRAAVIGACLFIAGCATEAIEPPKPVLREEPINSLALEQCLKVNGPEECAG